MINSVNSVNTENINAAKTSETASTLKTEKEVSLEDKVYAQVNEKKDTVELSNSGKGLSETAISDLRSSMQQNKLNLVLNMVNPTNNIYKKTGVSLNEESSLIQAFNTQRYLAKNAYKMYFKNNSSDLDEINSLKKQIASLEKDIAEEEKLSEITLANGKTIKLDGSDKSSAQEERWTEITLANGKTIKLDGSDKSSAEEEKLTEITLANGKTIKLDKSAE